MNNVKLTVLSAIAVLLLNTSQAQMAAVKSFDYSILEDKVLYIPTYEASEKYIAKMSKKGKYDKIQDAKERAELYNTSWKEAMAESDYDATDYEIRPYDFKDMVKSKDPKAILLYFRTDEYGNESANMLVTGPKKKTVAVTPITGLDLSDKGDIRLMINMLNESLNTAAEVTEDDGKSSRSGYRNKYKEALVNWYDGVEDKTFLVPAITHKNEKKEEEKNADIKEALELWTISKAEFTTEEVVNQKRLEGDPDCYYWKTFPIYTNSVLLTYNYNVLFSTEGDDVIIAFLGKGKMKPSAVRKIQDQIVTKAERYKRQLAD
ncbi:MAG: hypothetical protein WBG42_10535 [Cryomorphaceae bacterium]